MTSAKMASLSSGGSAASCPTERVSSSGIAHDDHLVELLLRGVLERQHRARRHLGRQVLEPVVDAVDDDGLVVGVGRRLGCRRRRGRGRRRVAGVVVVVAARGERQASTPTARGARRARRFVRCMRVTSSSDSWVGPPVGRPQESRGCRPRAGSPRVNRCKAPSPRPRRRVATASAWRSQSTAFGPQPPRERGWSGRAAAAAPQAAPPQRDTAERRVFEERGDSAAGQTEEALADDVALDLAGAAGDAAARGGEQAEGVGPVEQGRRPRPCRRAAWRPRTSSR